MPFRKPMRGTDFEITNREYAKTGGTPHRAFPTVYYPRCNDNDAAYEKNRLAKAKRFVSCWLYLSSRQVTLQVLSARTSLTSVFGMGTGGPSSQSKPTCLPYTLKTEHCVPLQSFESSLSLRFGQAFGLLVSVSSMHYCTSTSDLSTT